MNENNEQLEPIESAGGNNQKLFLAGAIGVVAILGVMFFVVKGSAAPTDSTPVGTSETAMEQNGTVAGIESEVPPAGENVRQIVIEGGSFYYKPNVITVKKGEKIQVVLTSKDMVHNFQIDELNVVGPMTKSGETSTVEFTADKVGSFEFYCAVGQHRKMGQVGTLTVTE